MSITDRIREYCKSKKIKNIDLVNAGCGSQQTVSFVLSGKQKPNTQFIEVLLKMNPDLDGRWLFTGEEEIVAEEPRLKYGYCRECLKKEGIIEYQEKEIKRKEQEIDNLRRELEELGKKLRQSGSIAS